jgi:hypothetical protein
MITGIYRHFKGGRYRVLYTATFQTVNDPKLDGIRVAVYLSFENGKVYTRPVAEFGDYVAHPNNPAISVQRFVLEEADE